MAEITRPALTSSLTSEFDGFLFAPIGEDRNGIVLSVLSALARLDLDPWQEAAKLARLPVEKATQRLTSLIVALSDESLTLLNPRSISSRLIAVLSRRVRPNIQLPGKLLDAGVVPNSTTVTHVFLFVASMCVVFGALTNIPARQSAAQDDNAHTLAASTVPPKVPLANDAP